MKKILLIGALCLLPNLAGAQAQWVLRLTSFIPVGGDVRSRIGELCGTVTGPKEQYKDVRVRVVSDPVNGRPPSNAIYNQLIDVNGRFCTLVHTYYGQAEASLWLTTKESEPKPILIKMSEE